MRPAFADRPLAIRLERFAAAELERFAATALHLDPECGAEVFHIAGGVAAFVGDGSPLNRALGLGMSGEVTSADIVTLERFYDRHRAVPFLGVCPLCHSSLTATLASRGWALDGFENVLFLPISPQSDGTADKSAAEPVAAAATGRAVAGPAAIEVREAISEADRRTWRLAAAVGFCDPLPPTDEQLSVATIATHRPGTRLFLAFIDGRVAGTGELFVTGGVAWLSADATLPQFRCRGVQTALQRHRLAVATHAGCSLAVSEAAPGSVSQRNMERAGFRLAYTRIDMVPAHRK